MQRILLIYNIHFRLTRVFLFKSSFHTKQKILLSCHDSDNSWVFFYFSFSKWLNYFTAYQLWSNSTVHTQAKLPPQIMGVGYGNYRIRIKDVKLLFPMCLTLNLTLPALTVPSSSLNNSVFPHNLQSISLFDNHMVYANDTVSVS